MHTAYLPVTLDTNSESKFPEQCGQNYTALQQAIVGFVFMLLVDPILNV